MPVSPRRSWDVKPAAVPPRSRLIPLQPMGLGTPYIESLTSYTCRLAQVHSVPIGKLFNYEIIPMINELFRYDSAKRMKGNVFKNYFAHQGHTFNGVGSCAEDLVRAVEALTLRPGLSFLTYLPWKHVLAEIGLLRRTRSWCPRCFSEWLAEGREIYEPLLWRLNAVTVCPLHHRELQTACPSCGRCLRLIGSHPGYCQACNTWLGETGTVFAQETLITEDFEFRLWSASEVGKLIAVGPDLSAEPCREQIAKAIRACTEHLTAGNGQVLMRLSHLPKDRISFWTQRNNVPVLNSLLKICRKMGVSLVELMTLGDPLAKGGAAVASIRIEAEQVIAHKRKKAREVMRQALNEEPAPSAREIAGRLKYKNLCSFKKVSPVLYQKIVERHRATVDFRPAPERVIGMKLRTDEEVRGALEAALARDPPISLRVVGIALGYTNGDGRLANRFPELYQAVLRRRQEFLVNHDREQQRELRKILRENPPPTFREIEKRLGYVNGSSLRRRFPQLSAAILARHKEYHQRQAAKLLGKLQSVLTEVDPPSLASVARRFNQQRNSMRKRFPDVCKAIKQRHADFKTSQAAKARAKCEEEIRRLSADLLAEGKRPSMKLVKSRMSGPDYLGYLQFWEILCDERRSLARD